MSAQNKSGFSVELKRLRLKAKLTQAELGAAIGVGGSSVAKWESGVATPRASTMTLLLALFNTTHGRINGERR